ncbi:MAG TPA: mechanosensitive ion channel domain-containing protein [Candidatus Binatia bacterium]|jgi:small conductance mechanosensitive channel|nr:mechanosensitive ion channel domain-containing protein [Candidatus Binatia bacterium]
MGQLFSETAAWWHAHWANALWIAVVAALIKLGVRTLRNRIIKAADDGDDTRETGKEKRAKTVAGIVGAVGNAAVAAFVFVMLLRLFGVDTVPLLAGAGVIGVAIGVSLQALIKDVIFGLYLVAENQYAVGDKVKIGEHEGTVHKMHLRVTELLDKDGNLIFIANGSVTSVVNYSLGEALKEKTAKGAALPEVESGTVESGKTGN